MEKLQRIEGYSLIRHRVFDNDNLNGSDIMVYNALMRFMNNETKTCYPSINTLAKRARLNKDTIYKSLDKLEKERLIDRDRGRGRVNRYIMLEPKGSPIFNTSTEAGNAEVGNKGKPETEIKETNNNNLNNTNKTNICNLANYKEPIETLNQLTGRNFKVDNRMYLGMIKARVKDGSSIKEVIEVVKYICKERMGTKFETFLRPSTIFNRTKYDNYKAEYKFLIKDLTNEQKCAILSTGTFKDKAGTLRDLE